MATEDKRFLQSASGDQLLEDIDFYIENGLYVFTEHYLLRRGYCCQSGCRHCPYGFAGKNLSTNNYAKFA